MELNTRMGANMYVHRMVERVAKSVFGIDETKLVPFMFLSNIEFEPYFSSLKQLDLLKSKERGMVIFTNPGRHQFGRYDITAMSNSSLIRPEDILFEVLSDMLGKNSAVDSFNKIYKR